MHSPPCLVYWLNLLHRLGFVVALRYNNQNLAPPINVTPQVKAASWKCTEKLQVKLTKKNKNKNIFYLLTFF